METGQFALGTIRCTNTQATPVFFDYGGTSGSEDFELNPCVGGSCYDTFPMVVPPGGGFAIMVAFHPAAFGLRSGRTLIVNDAGLPDSVVTFSGTGVPEGSAAAAVPLLDGGGRLALVASLAAAAVVVLVANERRGV